jgi:hypothetical protein
MGFFDNAKGAAIRTKLKAEKALLEREMANRKRAFGIVLFDLMYAMEKGNKSTAFHVSSHYEAAKADISEIQQRKDVKQSELEKLELESRKDKHKPTDTAAQKAKAAGKWISYAGNETKLSANLALLDREMKVRKESFGLDIYDFVTSVGGEPTETLASGIANVQKLASAVLGKSPPTIKTSETEIRAAIADARGDVERIQVKINEKLQEMALA